MAPLPRRLRRLALVAASGLLLGFALAQAGDAPSDADAVLDRIFDNLRGESQIATLEMTVTRPDDVQRFELRIYSEGEERALTRVVAPPRDAGQAFLNDGDNVFIYNPRLRRVLRLPPSGRSDSFLGSDISYSDLAGDDLRDQYATEIVADGDDAVTLALTPKPSAPTPYGRVEVTASKPDYAPTRIVYFDQRGTAVKEHLISDYTDVDGRRIPQRYEVRDLLDEGHRTVVLWTDARFDVEIPAACFTQNALEREGACER